MDMTCLDYWIQSLAYKSSTDCKICKINKWNKKTQRENTGNSVDLQWNFSLDSDIILLTWTLNTKFRDLTTTLCYEFATMLCHMCHYCFKLDLSDLTWPSIILPFPKRTTINLSPGRSHLWSCVWMNVWSSYLEPVTPTWSSAWPSPPTCGYLILRITISSIVMQPVVVLPSCFSSLACGLVYESQQQKAEPHSSPQVSLLLQHFHPSRKSICIACCKTNT